MNKFKTFKKKNKSCTSSNQMRLSLWLTLFFLVVNVIISTPSTCSFHKNHISISADGSTEQPEDCENKIICSHRCSDGTMKNYDVSNDKRLNDKYDEFCSNRYKMDINKILKKIRSKVESLLKRAIGGDLLYISAIAKGLDYQPEENVKFLRELKLLCEHYQGAVPPEDKLMDIWKEIASMNIYFQKVEGIHLKRFLFLMVQQFNQDCPCEVLVNMLAQKYIPKYKIFKC